MSTTIAEQISARFDGDGTRWRDDEGVELDAACREAGATVERRDGDGAVRYRFADGSGIVATAGAWDLALSDDDRCWCWAGEGEHLEVCPLAPRESWRIVTISGRGLPTHVDAEGYDTYLAAREMAVAFHDGEYRIEPVA